MEGKKRVVPGGGLHRMLRKGQPRSQGRAECAEVSRGHSSDEAYESMRSEGLNQ